MIDKVTPYLGFTPDADRLQSKIMMNEDDQKSYITQSPR